MLIPLMILCRYGSPTATHDNGIANYTALGSDLRIRVRSKFRLVSIDLRALDLPMIIDQCGLGNVFLSIKPTQIISLNA